MITKPTIYTQEYVLTLVTKLLQELKDNKDIVYLWELLEDKEYPRQCFSEWAEKFEDDKEISDTIKKIKEILETRAIVWAMKNNLNATSTIFHLKNNYKWVDKFETDNNNRNANYDATEELTPTQKKLIASRLSNG